MVPRARAHTRRVCTCAALLLFAHLLLPCAPCLAAPAEPGPPAVPDQELVVALELDKETLADSFLLVERSGEIYIPVCSLADALSLAISCDKDRAFGFALNQARPFVIDLEEGYTVHGRESFSINGEAFVQKGEILVNSGALSRWLPVDFHLRRETSTLEVRAREPLPLQAARKRRAFMAPKTLDQKRLYPDATPPRGAAAVPTADLAAEFSRSSDGYKGNGSRVLNSMNLSGDLLYMTGEAHVLAENEDLRRLDLTLSRRSAAGYRMGPLGFNQVALGSNQAPHVDGVGASTKPMYGLYLSNRPLLGGGQFLTHDMHGQLPPGWDAELFHNGTQIRYQPPTAEGMYHFVNLRVYYGVNSFKVVLHGPFGERQESEEVFVSDATTPTGELLYTLSAGWQTGLTRHEVQDGDAESNITFTSDFGLTRNLTGSLLVVRHTERRGSALEYFGAGVRTALRSTLLSLDVIQMLAPGKDLEGQLVSVKSSSRNLFGLNLELGQRFFHNYYSPQFYYSDPPLRTLTTVKGNSSFTLLDEIRVPYSVEIGFGTRNSGRIETTSQWRVSGGWNGWNTTLQADLSRLQGETCATSKVQVSTRLSDVSVRGEAGFVFVPAAKPSGVDISADVEIAPGLQLNSALSHVPADRLTGLRLGVSKRMGQVGYSVAAHGSTDGAYGFDFGVRSSVAAAPAGRLLASAEPLAPYGMVAVSATVAEPDGTTTPLPRVDFLLNGSRVRALPDGSGGQVIAFLQPDIPVDVTVDLTSIEDPFMVPSQEGCRIVPRGGVVARCDFTMTTGGEIDGTVTVRLARGREVPIKGVKVELAGEGEQQGRAQATTLSEESGYYLFKAVRPGRYLVRIPADELQRMKASTLPARGATVPPGGDMISGVDFVLAPADTAPGRVLGGPGAMPDQE
ncbi:carboxypeptidase-like regulatory domain-containing protein [Geomonas subterranea]|uniref:carboxypeptidase-like regulatory domain-containing protein n=1 Tax=Geomonas subterranea TaxID=2847989 RepID=UPI001C47E655|nr:carboxypeptidase-like regulatory domain-containing protein [Geomonas subterranea]QXM08033.1 carboxypeptidase-like regulatory domain-containing protein [Geomonas subterranea]